jgi:glycosyltransferase involved in cell wall biosynthesis
MDWKSITGTRVQVSGKSSPLRDFFSVDFSAQAFSWSASLLAEQLVENEGIEIIEAQEYEAPLYFFQSRRMLGLGPKRHPPCVVHLHSPTWLIATHNDWDTSLPSLIALQQREEFSIRTADLVICPSRFLAAAVEARYRFPNGTTKIIPYPLGGEGPTKFPRKADKGLTFCYAGRLERRKGALEWINAAVQAVQETPWLKFSFVGANVLGENRFAGEILRRDLIPDEIAANFRFWGQVPRAMVPEILSQADVAVVPSRWDNFPHTCMEAMGVGLPVLATQEGGMVEMLRDNHSGWLATSCSREGLLEAIRRVVATPAAMLVEMGNNASRDIRCLCGNKTVVESHLQMKSRLVEGGGKDPVARDRLSSQQQTFTSEQTAERNSLNGIAVGFSGAETLAGEAKQRKMCSFPRFQIMKSLKTALQIAGAPALALRIFREKLGFVRRFE